MRSVNPLFATLRSPRGWVLLDQLVFSAGSLGTTLLLARGLGVEAFGRYSALVLFSYLLLSVVNALVVAPFQVRAAGSEDPVRYAGQLLRLLLTLLGFLLLIFIAAWQFPFIRTAFPAVSPLLLLAFLAGFVLQDFFRRIFLATDQPARAFRIGLVSNGLQLPALLVAYWLGYRSAPVSLAIIAFTYLPALLLAFRYLPLSGNDPALRAGLLRHHWHDGRWLLLTAVLQWWSNNFIVALSGILLGFAALGAFRLAQTLFGVLNALLQVLENYQLPRGARLLHESQARARAFLRRIGWQSLVLFIPFLALAWFFPEPLFRLAGGAAYTGYAYALQGMSLLYLLILAGYPLRMAIRLLLLNRDFFIAYTLSFLFSLLAARWLVLEWHLNGVLAALIINQLLMLGYWQWVLYRKNFMLWK